MSGPELIEWCVSLIQELMLYEFELGCNAVKATKNILVVWRWRRSWLLYSNQMDKEIFIELQEPWWSGSQLGLKPWILRPCSKT